MTLALVTSASNCIGATQEECPENIPPRTPPRSQSSEQPTDTRWLGVNAYQLAMSNRYGESLLPSGTTVYLVPHNKGVIDIRRGPDFQPKYFVDFLEYQVADVGTPLQREMSVIFDESVLRERLVSAYAAFIEPIVQKHISIVPASDEFSDPRVYLESSNALLRAACIVKLQTPCTVLNVINLG